MQKPIVLLHGAIGAADYLEPLKTKLQESGANVYLLEFSGHGKTPFKANFGIGTFAEELQNFIIANNLVQPNIFGYSMGGYVALYLASNSSELIGKIATLGTKFDWNPESATRESKMLDPEQILLKVPKFAEALIKRHDEQKWRELLNRTAEMMLQLGSQNMLTTEVFAEIKNEVMLGVGDKDNMVSINETKNVFEALPNKSLYVLPNTKHPIENVDVSTLSQLLLDFFRS